MRRSYITIGDRLFAVRLRGRAKKWGRDDAKDGQPNPSTRNPENRVSIQRSRDERLSRVVGRGEQQDERLKVTHDGIVESGSNQCAESAGIRRDVERRDMEIAAERTRVAVDKDKRREQPRRRISKWWLYLFVGVALVSELWLNAIAFELLAENFGFLRWPLTVLSALVIVFLSDRIGIEAERRIIDYGKIWRNVVVLAALVSLLTWLRYKSIDELSTFVGLEGLSRTATTVLFFVMQVIIVATIAILTQLSHDSDLEQLEALTKSRRKLVRGRFTRRTLRKAEKTLRGRLSSLEAVHQVAVDSHRRTKQDAVRWTNLSARADQRYRLRHREIQVRLDGRDVPMPKSFEAELSLSTPLFAQSDPAWHSLDGCDHSEIRSELDEVYLLLKSGSS